MKINCTRLKKIPSSVVKPPQVELAQENQHGKSSSGMALTGLTSPSSTVTPKDTSHPCPFPNSVKLKAPVWHHCYPPTSLTPHPAPNHCSVKAYSTFSIRKEKETRHREEQAEKNSQWFSKSDTICFIYLVAWWYVMFLLSLHFNMSKLLLYGLITEFNYWYNKGKGSKQPKTQTRT